MRRRAGVSPPRVRETRTLHLVRSYDRREYLLFHPQVEQARMVSRPGVHDACAVTS